MIGNGLLAVAVFAAATGAIAVAGVVSLWLSLRAPLLALLLGVLITLVLTGLCLRSAGL